MLLKQRGPLTNLIRHSSPPSGVVISSIYWNDGYRKSVYGLNRQADADNPIPGTLDPIPGPPFDLIFYPYDNHPKFAR
jgi:hypothetical protein